MIAGIPDRLQHFEPTHTEALRRIDALHPARYALSRNALDGAVSGLSPYFTHGVVGLRQAVARVVQKHRLNFEDKLMFEFAWREFFHHVWSREGEAVLTDMRPADLWPGAYASELPADIREGRTGVPAIDAAVRQLYATGYLHNHARMWLASYVVHLRKVHWRVAADWLYGHLLDGDLASNHLSWQWVAGTGSHKPYLFNADNVARYAPASWHSPGSVIDTSYEALDRIARLPARDLRHESSAPSGTPAVAEPSLGAEPPGDLGLTAPDAAAVTGRDVWLVHPWRLGPLPAALPADALVIGVFVADFHRAWPWSDRRWRFVGSRMAELTTQRWHGDAATIGAALAGARRVRSIDEPHLAPWLARWAECEVAPALFPPVDRRCDSFSQWWARATRRVESAADLLPVNEVPAW